MTNLELIQRIAEIEGVNWTVAYPNQAHSFIGILSENDFTGTPPELIGKYNPLTDKGLLWDLMVKYQVDINHTSSANIWIAEKGRIEVLIKTKDDIPRAILECIVEANDNVNCNESL